MQLHLNDLEIQTALVEFITKHTGMTSENIGEINLISGRGGNGNRAEIELNVNGEVTVSAPESSGSAAANAPLSKRVAPEELSADSLRAEDNIATGSAEEAAAMKDAAEQNLGKEVVFASEEDEGPSPLPEAVTRKKDDSLPETNLFSDEQNTAAQEALDRVSQNEPEETDDEPPWEEPTAAVAAPEPAFGEPAPAAEPGGAEPGGTVGDIFAAAQNPVKPSLAPNVPSKGLFD